MAQVNRRELLKLVVTSPVVAQKHVSQMTDEEFVVHKLTLASNRTITITPPPPPGRWVSYSIWTGEETKEVFLEFIPKALDGM